MTRMPKVASIVEKEFEKKPSKVTRSVWELACGGANATRRV